jgi:thiamine pyrophosphate-dependent acetolactate synthase large subunit-like protein
MLDLTGPTLDLAQVAQGFGVPSVTARTAEELVAALDKSLATEGPTFVNARLTR